MKNKKIVIVLSILTIIFTIMGGTLAYWNWETLESQKTNLTFTIEGNYSCSVDGGGDITSSDVKIAPASCTNSKYAIQRELTVSSSSVLQNLNLGMNIWLNVDNLDTGLSNSQNFKYALTKSATSCENAIASGTFNGLTNENKVDLLKDVIYTGSQTEKYYLYIWLDAAETSTNTMEQKFQLSLGGKCSSTYSEPILNGTDPELVTGMIPVTISNTGVVTTADISTQWYSYENKQWANAVLVKKDATSGVTGFKSREFYMKNPGETVIESDILAYYVWIPRYKYTFPKANGSPELISIVFEDKDTAKSIPSTGKASGTNYYTHPAFTFGENNELNGIWVGKFETGHSTLSSSTTDNNLSCKTENCTNANGLIIKPNVTSLRYNSISNFFYASRSMSKTNNPFGFDASTTNTHMMKNSEWGAIAYLSHSIYGKGNVEITINNNSSHITGAGNGKTYFSPSTGTYTHPQSSTGNISGVFDISGGSYEHTMGNHSNNISSSGFGRLPESKYYDVYTVTDNADCKLAECGGHALYETAGWYSDYADFVSSDRPWFKLGGYRDSGSSAGAFGSSDDYGNAGDYDGFRSVVTKGM